MSDLSAQSALIDTFFAEHSDKERSIFEATIAGQRIPLPVLSFALEELGQYPGWPKSFAFQWPRILARAGAKVRAQEQQAATQLRYSAKEGDFVARQDGPLYGAFHKLGRLSLQYQRFDGTLAKDILRDVFLGGDAAIVLPYDPERDRILLVEQLRAGPIQRGDRQPWILEPVAGLIDAWDTPEATALRELQEEAHLQAKALLPTAAYYPSPGASAEYFYGFLAIVDLPDDHAQFGGLEEEAEDLRLHLLSLEDARLALRRGEINAGPLVLLLLELFSQREAILAGNWRKT